MITLFTRAVLALALMWSGASMATAIGPVDDGSYLLGSGPVSKWIQTTWKSGNLSGNDLIHIKKDGSVVVYVQANLVITLPSTGSIGDTELTTIYGKRAAGSTVTGFDPSDLISFDSQEQHIGNSGSSYYSYIHESVVASALPSYFTGIDLSGFDTTSTTQTYDIFRTLVPMAEILSSVPEPNTLALYLTVLCGLRLNTRRKPHHPR